MAKPIVLEDLTYIPASVSKKYLSSLKRAKSDPAARVKIYREIFRDWVVDVKLYDYIVSDVNKRYNTELSKGEADELAWAVKAVASSGLERYKSFVANIAETAQDKRIAKHAIKMNERYPLFQSNAQIVHDVADLPNKFSWKEKQLTNILAVDDAKFRKQAVRAIRKTFPKNKTMLNQLSDILVGESLTSTTATNDDFYAWCARLLGESGYKKYLPVLERVQEEAQSRKVRKFAKKYAKVLKKS